MKRSRINRIILDADAFLRSLNVHLPPFAYWSPDDWRSKGEDVREIVDNQLGWDITDFGSGDFQKTGLFLFTLRNGSVENLRTGRGKTYAEKIMIVDVDQVTPMHFHWSKTEDIINRGGGNLAIQLYAAAADETLDPSAPVTVSMDGVRHTLPAGHTALLEPGQSITLETGMYHEFRGVDGKVLVGEVSAVNDDAADNRFLEPAGRFPDIDEDTDPVHLLVGDYADYYRPAQTA
jgi:D-lyxose ketol-isomerase